MAKNGEKSREQQREMLFMLITGTDIASFLEDSDNISRPVIAEWKTAKDFEEHYCKREKGKMPTYIPSRLWPDRYIWKHLSSVIGTMHALNEQGLIIEEDINKDIDEDSPSYVMRLTEDSMALNKILRLFLDDDERLFWFILFSRYGQRNLHLAEKAAEQGVFLSELDESILWDSHWIFEQHHLAHFDKEEFESLRPDYESNDKRVMSACKERCYEFLRYLQIHTPTMARKFALGELDLKSFMHESGWDTTHALLFQIDSYHRQDFRDGVIDFLDENPVYVFGSHKYRYDKGVVFEVFGEPIDPDTLSDVPVGEDIQQAKEGGESWVECLTSVYA